MDKSSTLSLKTRLPFDRTETGFAFALIATAVLLLWALHGTHQLDATGSALATLSSGVVFVGIAAIAAIQLIDAGTRVLRQFRNRG